MSPGNTMLRIYSEMKARIMIGAFLPGERLDPARLATGLAASRTPVRDALLRLSGERIVDSWEQEGFRMPQVSEPAIRDIYDWTNEVLHVVARAAARRTATDVSDHAVLDEGYARAVATCFIAIAMRSSNHEHRIMITNLNDRSAAIRRAEVSILDDALSDVATIHAATAVGDWPEVGRTIDQFHRRRIRIIAEVASVLRSRAPL